MFAFCDNFYYIRETIIKPCIEKLPLESPSSEELK
jgi:hypothetical protein